MSEMTDKELVKQYGSACSEGMAVRSVCEAILLSRLAKGQRAIEAMEKISDIWDKYYIVAVIKEWEEV